MSQSQSDWTIPALGEARLHNPPGRGYMTALPTPPAPMATRFRSVLTRWLLGTAAIVAVPGLMAELRRPWDELDAKVHTAEAVLASTMAALPPADQRAMARFARAQVGSEEAPADAFVAAITGAPHPDGAPIPDLATWAGRLAADPEASAAFSRSWPVLARARASANRVGLQVNDIYLTIDEGQRPGFWQDNIAFVLGSQPWWKEPVAPGEGYDIAAIDGLFWRASYLPSLGGRPGTFGHNPAHDPLLPRFETDEWGTWYSVWTSEDTGEGGTLALTMDIEASTVQALMAKGAQRSFLAIVSTLGLVVIVARVVATRVSQPVTELHKGAQAVLESRYDYGIPLVGSQEFIELITTVNRMIRQLGERVNLLSTLEKLLSKELAANAAREGLSLSAHEAECTVMFTDFAGFSTVTAAMPPAAIVEALNAYFELLIGIIKAHGGFPDKYIGDAVVAFFGAPVPNPRHADAALRCAVAMQRALRPFNEARKAAGLVTFEMRVGLNSGVVLVGAIGCEAKLEYTSIGETTNLANRMEAASPIGHLCIGAGTRARLTGPPPAGVTLGPEEDTVVKGYRAPVPATKVWIDARPVDV